MDFIHRGIIVQHRGDRYYVPKLDRHFPNEALARRAIDLSLQSRYLLHHLARQAVVHGGALLGHFTTKDGNVPIYLTTERPRNMTEWADHLRIPPPSKL